MRRHAFDPVSFGFGLLFALTGLAIATGVLRAEDLAEHKPWPWIVIAVGVLLLIPTLRRPFDRREQEEPEAQPDDTTNASQGERERAQ